MDHYVIYNPREDGYWSNSEGWVSLEDCTVFTELDTGLPIPGTSFVHWGLTIPDNSEWVWLEKIQVYEFARFISENCTGDDPTVLKAKQMIEKLEKQF